ncbi:MAG: DHH family phosphoesterase [Ignavibacteria bacterium]
MNHPVYDTLSLAWQALSTATSVLISAHIDPDGDSIGSSLGLLHILRSQGIQAHIVQEHPIPKNLQFLPHDSAFIQHDDPDIAHIVSTADAWCILDLNAPQRLGPHILPLFEQYTGEVFLFDHHVNPILKAQYSNVIIESSSTCEIIARMALAAHLEINAQAAECLYTGIMTDTGGFRHSRTNADVMRLAATLIESGADPVKIYDKVMNAQSLASMQLLGLALSHLSISHEGALILMIIRREQLHGYSSEDLEGFVNYTLSIDGAKIGGLITEWEDGTVKMSLRSKPTHEVRSIAEYFGGGGHMQAAGARVRQGNLEEIVGKIQELVKI